MNIIRKHWAPILVVIVAVFCSVMPIHDVRWISGHVFIRADFWSAVFFIVFYTLLAPWWRNTAGRMFVYLDFGVMCALLGSILFIDFGRSISDVVSDRLVTFGLALVAGTILSRIYVLGALHEWKFKWPWKHDPPGNIPPPPRELEPADQGTGSGGSPGGEV